MIEDYRRVGFEVRRLNRLMSRCLEAGVKAEGIDEITLMNGWIQLMTLIMKDFMRVVSEV